MPDTSYRSSASDSILRWCKGFATQWQLQSMAILGVVYMLIFNFVPIYGLTIAFKNYSVVSGIGGSEWIGLENFKIILQDKYFWNQLSIRSVSVQSNYLSALFYRSSLPFSFLSSNGHRLKNWFKRLLIYHIFYLGLY